MPYICLPIRQLRYVLLVIIAFISLLLMTVDMRNAVSQSATSIEWSDDPSTSQYQVYGTSIALYHSGIPVGTWLDVRRNGSLVYQVRTVTSNNPMQFGGQLSSDFAGSGDGTDWNVGGAGCRIQLSGGHKYCGVSIPSPTQVPTNTPIPPTIDLDGDRDGILVPTDQCPSIPAPNEPNGCPPNQPTELPWTPTPLPINPSPFPDGIPPTDTPTLFPSRTPDYHAPCNLVAHNGQNALIRANPSTADDNIVSHIAVMQEPVPVVSAQYVTGTSNQADNTLWWHVSDGWIRDDAVDQGGTNCDDITGQAPHGTQVPVETPEVVNVPSYAEVARVLEEGGCSGRIDAVTHQLSGDVQYMLLDYPQEACHILELAEGNLGSAYDESVQSQTLGFISRLLAECPSEAVAYAERIALLYNANPDAGLFAASQIEHDGDQCQSVRLFLGGYGLIENERTITPAAPIDPSTELSVLVVSCLPHVEYVRIVSVIDYIAHNLVLPDDLGDSPCDIIRTINILPVIPREYSDFLDVLLHQCRFSMERALYRLVLVAAGFRLSGDPCLDAPAVSTPAMPPNSPAAFRNCLPSDVNIWVTLINNVERYTLAPSQIEQDLIYDAADPCAALHNYISRGIIYIPTSPRTPPPTPTTAPGVGGPETTSIPSPVTTFVIPTTPQAPPPTAMPNMPPATQQPTDDNDTSARDLIHTFDPQGINSALLTVENNGQSQIFEFADSDFTTIQIYDDPQGSQQFATVNGVGALAYIVTEGSGSTLFYQPLRRSDPSIEPSRSAIPLPDGFTLVPNSRLAWLDNTIFFVALEDTNHAIGIYRVDISQLFTNDAYVIVSGPHISNGLDPVVIGGRFLVFANSDNRRLYRVRLSEIIESSSTGSPLNGQPADLACGYAHTASKNPLEDQVVFLCGNALYISRVEDAANVDPNDLQGVQGNLSDVSPIPSAPGFYTFDNQVNAYVVHIHSDDRDPVVLTFPVNGKPIHQLEWTQY